MNQLKKLWELILALVEAEYNGEVTISFKCGKVQPIMRKTKETIKIY